MEAIPSSSFFFGCLFWLFFQFFFADCTKQMRKQWATNTQRVERGELEGEEQADDPFATVTVRMMKSPPPLTRMQRSLFIKISSAVNVVQQQQRRRWFHTTPTVCRMPIESIAAEMFRSQKKMPALLLRQNGPFDDEI